MSARDDRITAAVSVLQGEHATSAAESAEALEYAGMLRNPGATDVPLWVAHGTWIAEQVDECTCNQHYGAHERGCGYDPLLQVATDADAALLVQAHNELVARLGEAQQ